MHMTNDSAKPAKLAAPSVAPAPPHHQRPHRLLQVINLVTVVVPFIGVIAAAVLVWGWGMNWTTLGIFGVMYLVTAVGITVGYHRLFTHRAFATTRPMKVLLGIMGSMAMEGPILFWVSVHRRHHQHADGHDDPHSPHHHGEGIKAMLAGLWHAHVGWMIEGKTAGMARYVGDLRQDKVVRYVSKMFPLWVVLGLVIPTIAGGLLTMTWTGALLGFIWGGLVRIFFVHHVTWSINSVCHFWGYKSFRGDDESRNNPIFGVLGLGEGWHNNHHAFPTSARHGLRWWEFDASYLLIRAMGLVGLAWDIRTPRPDLLAARKR